MDEHCMQRIPRVEVKLEKLSSNTQSGDYTSVSSQMSSKNIISIDY